MSNIIKFPQIAGIEITTDEVGRFNLNALHLILNDLTDRCTSNEITYREQIAKNNQRGENMVNIFSTIMEEI
ncbi:hypothetical protein L3081_09320 [Colwellia sp. MSW7]|uniref:Uncharacterized protein n=1 Tax=Colwellia maritima TaxID=2912588 RepID=A0ABS9X005_9GAMM|nr:hypothetical protein [Colwellia maritima]MCI2283553.1 hypothetical protein [Colwellia maritima]